jgi:4'-phosphopantetheinyl transferase EntD
VNVEIEARILAKMLPASVASAEVLGCLEGVTLFPQEEALVARAVDRRRNEFATGRECARDALRRLGFTPMPIGRDEHGAPSWPEGVVGSITHCDGYCASAVAWAREIQSIGIDAEPNQAIPAGVLKRIALSQEKALLDRCAAAHPAVSWDRLLFSAKESVYKAYYQLTRRRLDFGDMRILVEASSATFNVQLQVSEPTSLQEQFTELTGRWRVQDGLVVTAVALATG